MSTSYRAELLVSLDDDDPEIVLSRLEIPSWCSLKAVEVRRFGLDLAFMFQTYEPGHFLLCYPGTEPPRLLTRPDGSVDWDMYAEKET